MIVPEGDADSARCGLSSDHIGSGQRIQIIILWCLQREALRGWNYILLLTPAVISGYFIVLVASVWYPEVGLRLQQYLWGIAAFCLVLGGVRHASGAVCWEVSDELRDLVRLTDFNPTALIWCKSLCRWWTISLSLLLVFPLALFALTNGKLNGELVVAAGSWLILLALLTAGFAMIASVSSNQASNAEMTAAAATFLLMLLYHILFWGLSAIIGFAGSITSGGFNLPTGSFGHRAMLGILNLAPITGLFRAISSPGSFSCLDMSYWLHLLTGIFCLRAATVVMRNRFRVTTQGDALKSDRTEAVRSSKTPALLRPRCTDRPFLWKDQYILGGGRRSRWRWLAISVLALMGVFAAFINGFPLAAGITAMCFAPLLLAVRFDSLMTAEFRHQTWNSLMLLPINPLSLLVAKLHAAAWEHQALLFPVTIAGAVAFFVDPTIMFQVTTIALAIGIMMLHISVLNQFYAKTWWIGPLMACLFIGVLVGVALVWAVAPPGVNFIITLLTLAVVSAVMFWHIRWRLHNWIDA